MKKYELTSEIVNYLGPKLHRIKALRDFGLVKAGELWGLFAEQLLKTPNFDVVFNTIDNGGSFGFNVKQFRNINITDIGYSDKTIILGGEDV